MDMPKLKYDMQIVVFSLDEPRYALDLFAVERVVRAVEITSLPKAPEIVLGVINVIGQVVPVVDVRKRFRLPGREMDLSDRFIIARTSRRFVALVADDVIGVQKLENRQIINAEQDLPFAEYIKGVAKVDGNLILIHDLDRFLSLDEERKLEKTLSKSKI
jgi:purine-binding chemotaxis protein CheW